MGVGGTGDGDGWRRESRLLDEGGGGGHGGGTELGFDGVEREAFDGTGGKGRGELFIDEDKAGIELELDGGDVLILSGFESEALSFFMLGGGGLCFGIGGGDDVGLCLVMGGGGGGGGVGL